MCIRDSFGEDLPRRFYNCLKRDKLEADLLLVIGTSLEVPPFNGIVADVRDTCPRVLINNNVVGPFLFHPSQAISEEGWIQLDAEEHEGWVYRDVYLGGDCQEVVQTLAAGLGFQETLHARYLELKQQKEDGSENAEEDSTTSQEEE